MRTFERGDVIKVPFPYTDRATRQSRPAVVVSTAQLQELHGLWISMPFLPTREGRVAAAVVERLARSSAVIKIRFGH